LAKPSTSSEYESEFIYRSAKSKAPSIPTVPMTLSNNHFKLLQQTPYRKQKTGIHGDHKEFAIHRKGQ
jgi:hypothetical protein